MQKIITLLFFSCQLLCSYSLIIIIIIIIQWLKRYLTPYGKITVIKSLAIAKHNHLVLTLPNPIDKYIQQLQLFYDFLWDSKRDKIKKKYDEGGLKMLDIDAYIKSLKCCWMRRLITSNSKWVYLVCHMYSTINQFSMYGHDF